MRHRRITFSCLLVRRFGKTDYLDSNSMYESGRTDGNIPVKTEGGKTVFLKEVADPRDASLIQTNVVASTAPPGLHPCFPPDGLEHLSVVNKLKEVVPEMKASDP